MKKTLGIDTSNYTTSVATFDGVDGVQSGRLLQVPEGGLGLRQSDALFQHTKELHHRVAYLKDQGHLDGIQGVAASTQPRAVEGSYMPCFLAGEGLGRSLAYALDVPFFEVSHQQGHIDAAAWSAGHMELLDSPMLAWHLSGGTTELLLVEPEGLNVKATLLGGTSDISAGQLIDRLGVSLGIPFPAGKGIDALAQQGEPCKGFAVKVHDDLTFSLSGMENKSQQLLAQGESPAQVARFILETLARTINRVTNLAKERYPNLPVLCSGGVASNNLLRERMKGAYFATPQCSTDNAVGVAILASRLLH